MAGRRKKKKPSHGGGHADERWLLTYADLITLLMALFMVLWSISSVNISKLDSLQRSLEAAFSGRIMPGGQGIKENGGSNRAPAPADNTPMSSLNKQVPQQNESKQTPSQRRAAARAEQAKLLQVQKTVEKIAAEHKLSGKIKTTLSKDGLHIRITTDDLLFASGSAELQDKAKPLVKQLSQTLIDEGAHAVYVYGHTDNVPIHGRYRSNWNLSGERAANVVLQMIADGVAARRLTSAGRADIEPVASNESAGGRSLNRRVELLLPRQHTGGQQESIADSVFPKP